MRGDEKQQTAMFSYLNLEQRVPAGHPLRAIRQMVEMVFGWGKLDRIMRKFKLHGVERVDWLFRLLATANNLVRMVKLRKLIPAQ
jgi:hypothetical protein